MAEESDFKSSAISDLSKRWSARSISTSARALVLMSLVMLAVICIAAFGSLRIQSTEVDNLFLTVNPALDDNSDIFRDMTEAQNALLRYQLLHDLKILTPYREMRVEILSHLEPLHIQIAALTKNHSDSAKASIAELEMQQSEAIKLWMANALRSERAVLNSENPNFTQSANLFEDFQQANSRLNEVFQLERSRARNRSRAASTSGTTVVIAAAVAASLFMLVFGSRLARSISKPTIALRGLIRRHREGDLTVRARVDLGPAEIRELSRDFNLLMENEAELDQNRSLAQRMHELTVKIEHSIRAASNTQQALQVLCTGLGEGIGVDRVMADAIGIDLRVDTKAQWYRPDLPPLGDIPPELIPHMTKLAQTLWDSSKSLVYSDRPIESDRSEHDTVFYRSTDFRASIMVSVGLGDQLVGMIYVVTVDSARHWSDSEVQAVERVAALLAQFIVEQTHRDQLNEHVEKLELLNRQKDTFVATVSHELRTPLTSIIGYLEVLKDGYAGDLTAEQARMLEVMDRNAIRLLSLIQDLLALNKRESEASQIEMANVSMPELVTTVCQELTPLAESGAIKVECDAGPSRAVVQGDRGKLQSAVVNIVSNAIKFSPRGAVVNLGCTVDESNHRVLFTCQDRGIGIPAADQGELFTRFYRASNAMTKFIPGTGLGLTIVKQIVNDHGGEIRLTSVEGIGTTVVIDLPLSPQGSV
ncbi:MAG: ATP-binding protein [Ilumatobacteraceae bacterium]